MNRAQDPLARALLGAILRDPAQIDRLGPVNAAYFANQVHQQVAHVMLAMAAMTQDDQRTRVFDLAQESGKNEFRDAIYRVAERPDAGFTIADLASAERTCEEASLAPHYLHALVNLRALDVIGAHAHRMASGLRYARSPREGVRNTIDHAERAEIALTNLATRLGLSIDDDVYDTTIDAVPSLAKASGVDRAANGSSSQARRVLQADFYKETWRENRLLASLTQHPEQIEQIREWLHPEDFADARRADIYKILLRRYENAEPITPLLITADAQAAGAIPTERRFETLYERLTKHGAAAAVGLGKEVVDHAVQRDVLAAAATMNAAVRNGDPRRAMTIGIAAVAGVANARERHERSVGYMAPYRPPVETPISRAAARSAMQRESANA